MTSRASHTPWHPLLRRWAVLVGVVFALLLATHFLGDSRSAADASASSHGVVASSTDAAPAGAEDTKGCGTGHRVTIGCGVLITGSISTLLARDLGLAATLTAGLVFLARQLKPAIPVSDPNARLRLCVARV